MHPVRRRIPAIFCCLLLCLITGTAATTILLRSDRLFTWGESRHICHRCGAERVSKHWSFVEINGPTTYRIEPTPISKMLSRAGINPCEHRFIVLSTLEKRLSLNPSPLMHEAHSENAALKQISTNESVRLALGVIDPVQAQDCFERLCAMSLRPNSTFARVRQMLDSNIPALEIADFLKRDRALTLVKASPAN